MAKSFKGGLDSLIGGVAPKKKAKVKGAVKQPASKAKVIDPVRAQMERDWAGDILAAKRLGITLQEYHALQEKRLDEHLKAHPKKPGRPRTSTKVPKDTTEEGTLPGEKRATFIVKEEQLEKLKAVAYWDRSKIKDVITAALEKYLDAYEKKNGPIKKVKQ
jgi:hypothetical protein